MLNNIIFKSEYLGISKTIIDKIKFISMLYFKYK